MKTIKIGFIILMFLYISSSSLGQIDLANVRSAKWNPTQDLIAINLGTGAEIIPVVNSNLDIVTNLSIPKFPTESSFVEVFDMAWNTNGTKFALSLRSETIEGRLMVWETTSWQLLLNITYQPGYISWSPDSRYMLVQGNLLDLDTLQTLNTINSFNFPTGYFAWSPNQLEQIVVTRPEPGNVSIINPFTKEILRELNYDSYFVPSYNSNGTKLALVRFENMSAVIDILETQDFTVLQSLPIGDAISESPSIFWMYNDKLITIGVNRVIREWDISTATFEIIAQLGIYDHISVSPDGKRFISAPSVINNSDAIAIYDIATKSILVQRLAIPLYTRSLAINVSGTQITQLSNAKIVEFGQNQNIQARISPEVTGSVVFDLNGIQTIDNESPYSIPLPPVGVYTLSAVPYSQANGMGDAGVGFTVNFEVVDGGITPTPTPPTPTPSPTPIACTNTIPV